MLTAMWQSKCKIHSKSTTRWFTAIACPQDSKVLEIHARVDMSTSKFTQTLQVWKSRSKMTKNVRSSRNERHLRSSAIPCTQDSKARFTSRHVHFQIHPDFISVTIKVQADQKCKIHWKSRTSAFHSNSMYSFIQTLQVWQSRSKLTKNVKSTRNQVHDDSRTSHVLRTARVAMPNAAFEI